MDNKQIPFTVIGGFLGAGKTSLVNHILHNATGRYAVLVNDFGALNIDEKLIEQHSGETIALANGCICCSLAAGFSAGLGQVLDNLQSFDHVVIEASGIANPQRIQDIARIERSLLARGNVVLLDGEQIRQQGQDSHIGRLVLEQILAADMLIINKQGLMNAEEQRALVLYLDQLNRCPRLFTDWAEVSPDLVLNLPLGLEKRKDSLLLEAENHDLYSRIIRCNKLISRSMFERWSEGLSADVLRGKGLVRFSDSEATWLWQKVGPKEQLSIFSTTMLTDTSSGTQGTNKKRTGDDTVMLLGAEKSGELLIIAKNKESLPSSID